MKAQILKRLTALGETLEPGDIVDVSGWRHVKSLENNRYIKLVIEEAKPVATPKPKKAKKETVEE